MGKFRAMLVRVSQETVMQDWQIDALKTYWKGHFQIVHTHHGHEENLFNPMLKERVELPAKLEKDHEQILKLMNKVDDEVAKISSGAGSTLQPVLKAFDKYAPDMKNHLTEEENICVPLMRAYFEEIKESATIVEAGGDAAEGTESKAKGATSSVSASSSTVPVPLKSTSYPSVAAVTFPVSGSTTAA